MLLSAQCGLRKTCFFPDDWQVRRRLSIHWFHIRKDCFLSVVPFVPFFPCCVFDCVHVCTPSLGVKHKLIHSPHADSPPAPPPTKGLKSATKSKWLFFYCLEQTADLLLGKCQTDLVGRRRCYLPQELQMDASCFCDFTQLPFDQKGSWVIAVRWRRHPEAVRQNM